jgi:hypothetical protein
MLSVQVTFFKEKKYNFRDAARCTFRWKRDGDGSHNAVSNDRNTVFVVKFLNTEYYTAITGSKTAV